MIVTDICAYVHALVIALEYHFYVKKEAKYHILFNKSQCIDHIAIKT